MAHHTHLLCCLLVFVAIYHQGHCGNFQAEREFINRCFGCRVSDGLGFNTFPGDCSCFYICQFTRAGFPFKTNTFTSHKRCCPCGTVFSKKLLTCVDYRSKQSSCIPTGANTNNPCAGQLEDDRIPRQDPDNIDGLLCSGYATCKLVGTQLFPFSTCCPDNECYNDAAETCSVANCNTGFCQNLEVDEKDDCECDQPIVEVPDAINCLYTSVPSNELKFMGKESMIMYDCAPGTCWEQDKCACVLANNTGFVVSDDCKKYLSMDFESNSLIAEAGDGYDIYAESERVSYVEGEAIFDRMSNQPTYINTAGLANTWLGNELVMRIEFTLTDDDGSSINVAQCLLGNCFNPFGGSGSSTIRVRVERGAASTGTGIELEINYQDNPLAMSPTLNEEEVDFELDLSGNPLALDAEYTLWVIFCGDEDKAGLAVLDSTQSTVASAESILIDPSYNLIMEDSGFVFGRCPGAAPFEGKYDEIEFWTCKPKDDAEFVGVDGVIFNI